MSFRVWPGVSLRVVVGVFQSLVWCVVESGGWVSFREWCRELEKLKDGGRPSLRHAMQRIVGKQILAIGFIALIEVSDN